MTKLDLREKLAKLDDRLDQLLDEPKQQNDERQRNKSSKSVRIQTRHRPSTRERQKLTVKDVVQQLKHDNQRLRDNNAKLTLDNARLRARFESESENRRISLPDQGRATAGCSTGAMQQPVVKDKSIRHPRLFSGVMNAHKRQLQQQQTTTPIADRREASMERTPASGTRSKLRNEVMRERLKELELDNLNMKRQIAGLTPNDKENERIRCQQCKSFKKQKTQQAEFFNERLLRTRELAKEHERRYDQLSVELKELNLKIDELNEKYERDIARYKDTALYYKEHSKRLQQWNRTNVKGFRSDVKLFKQQITDIEKHVLQTKLMEFT